MTKKILGAGVLALGLPCMASLAHAGQFGDCEVWGQAGSVNIETVTPGALTVAAILPAPDTFKGDSPETISGGFEYCLAANIAHRAGLDGVQVRNVPWPALIAGQLSGFDVAMTNIYITDERKNNVDFTVPYFEATSGVLIRSEDAGKITPETIGQYRIGVFLASLQDRFVDQELKSSAEVRRFESTPDLITALRANQIDAVIYDLSLLLPAATSSDGALIVTGQYKIGGDVGGVLVKDKNSKEGFDAAINAMKEDGTLSKLVNAWYAPLWGVDIETIPYWN